MDDLCRQIERTGNVLSIVLTHEDEPTLEPMTARAAMVTFVYVALLAIGIAAG